MIQHGVAHLDGQGAEENADSSGNVDPKRHVT